MSILKVKLVRPNAVLPRRQTAGSAGYDLTACLEEPVQLLPNQTRLIPTGLAIQLQHSGLVGLVFARSSLGVKFGVVPANGVGVIDSDYRGEVLVGLRNTSDTPYTVQPGDRVAQLLILPVELPELELCEQLEETQRGAGGFGSTGGFHSPAQ